MMIIDVRKLNAQKQYSGSMEFDYTADDTLTDMPNVHFKGTVKVKFDYEINYRVFR